MKIIVFGANISGLLIATEFFENHDVIMLDKNIPEDFGQLDIETVQGMPTDIKLLKSINADETDIFIACSDYDENNILACMNIKTLSNAQTICFIKNDELALSIQEAKRIKHNNDFVDWVIRPKELLSRDLFRIITVPDATDVENFAKNRARMLEYPIKEHSVLINKKIKDCSFPKETLIVGITRDGELFIPNGDTELKLNDKVIFMGKVKPLDYLAAEIFKTVNKINSVTIIGGGDIGLSLAEQLQHLNLKIEVIERDYKRCEYISGLLNKVIVIHGDGTNLQLLENESVEYSDVVVCVTDNDEKNLLCGLLAKQAGVKKVIARVSKEPNVALFEKVGIDVAVSVNDVAIHEINNHFYNGEMSILASVECGQGNIIEISLPENYKETKIMDLRLPHQAIIGIIERFNEIIIPNGLTTIKGYDKLIIFTMKEAANSIKEYFLGK